jgi:hypothetical protein
MPGNESEAVGLVDRYVERANWRADWRRDGANGFAEPNLRRLENR